MRLWKILRQSSVVVSRSRYVFPPSLPAPWYFIPSIFFFKHRPAVDQHGWFVRSIKFAGDSPMFGSNLHVRCSKSTLQFHRCLLSLHFWLEPCMCGFSMVNLINSAICFAVSPFFGQLQRHVPVLPGHAGETEQDARGSSGTAIGQQGADGEVWPSEDRSGESGETTHESAEHLDRVPLMGQSIDAMYWC